MMNPLRVLKVEQVIYSISSMSTIQVLSPSLSLSFPLSPARAANRSRKGADQNNNEKKTESSSELVLRNAKASTIPDLEQLKSVGSLEDDDWPQQRSPPSNNSPSNSKRQHGHKARLSLSQQNRQGGALVGIGHLGLHSSRESKEFGSPAISLSRGGVSETHSRENTVIRKGSDTSSPNGGVETSRHSKSRPSNEFNDELVKTLSIESVQL